MVLIYLASWFPSVVNGFSHLSQFVCNVTFVVYTVRAFMVMLVHLSVLL